MTQIQTELRTAVDRFLRDAPSLQDLHREHVEVYGESIPYLFVAEVARELAERVRLKDETDVLSALHAAEDVFEHGSEAQKDLIGAGFLESFPSDGEPGDELRQLVQGPLRMQMLRWVR